MLENVDLTAILVTQLQVVTETFHSEILGENEIPSVMVVIHAIWAVVVNIIDKAVEAVVVALDIKIHSLQRLREVWEWAAMAAAPVRMA